MNNSHNVMILRLVESKHFPKAANSTDFSGCPVSSAYGEEKTALLFLLVHSNCGWATIGVTALSRWRFFSGGFFDARLRFSEKPLYRRRTRHQIIRLKRIIGALCDQPAFVVAESLGSLSKLRLLRAYHSYYHGWWW